MDLNTQSVYKFDIFTEWYGACDPDYTVHVILFLKMQYLYLFFNSTMTRRGSNSQIYLIHILSGLDRLSPYSPILFLFIPTSIVHKKKDLKLLRSNTQSQSHSSSSSSDLLDFNIQSFQPWSDIQCWCVLWLKTPLFKT